MTDPLPAAPVPSRRALAALAVTAIALALALYRPWASRPFAILDFSEFLPLLFGHQGFGSRLLALVHYYAIEHGRLNLTSYVALAAKWSFLGPNPVWWQWARLAEMLAVVGLTYNLARRFGASVSGAAAGAGLMIVAHTATDAWVRQTMGEPLGLLAILAAALVADGYRSGTDRWRLPIVAVLVVTAILAKEMLLGAVPLVMVAAVARDRDGRLAPPDTGPRSRRFVGWVSGAALLSLAAVAWVAHGAGGGGFGASYGAANVSAGRFAWLWQTILVPAGLRPGLDTWLLPANLALLIVVVLGFAASWRVAGTRPHLVGILALGLGLPAIGAALYVPWPYFNLFYGLPFLVGPAMLLATAVTGLTGTSLTRAAAIAGVVVVLAGAGGDSAHLATASAARQQVDHGVALALGSAGGDSVIVFEPYLPQQAWQGTGATLVRYAVAMHLADSLPPANDLPCGKAAAAIQAGGGRHTFITYSDRCGVFRNTSRRIRSKYRYLDLSGIHTDTLEADILAPLTPVTGQ
ncbi:MAG TPA: hypothetical protein VFI39_08705 [Gemmatimonadales bacterium]|nr:hypothetical protein [Gemmatimonadales bacterium]